MKAAIERIARRLAQQRGVIFLDLETAGAGVRFSIANGMVGPDAKRVWCPVPDTPTHNTEALVEAVALALELGIAELRGVALPMICRGVFRIYFNRHGAAPLVWCVATDHWELAVAAVTIRTAAGTRYQPKPTPDAEDGKPSAWIVASGVLAVVGSEAIITGAGTPEVAER